MTIDEMISELQAAREAHGGDAPVRLVRDGAVTATVEPHFQSGVLYEGDVQIWGGWPSNGQAKEYGFDVEAIRARSWPDARSGLILFGTK